MRVGQFLYENLERLVALPLLAILAVLLFVQIVARYAFFTSVNWIEEFSRIIFVWFLYMSMSLAIVRRRHVRVAVIDYLVPRPLHKFMHLLADLLWLFFNLLFIYYGALLVKSSIDLPAETAVLRFNMAYVHLVVPLAFVLMTFRLCAYIGGYLWGEERPWQAARPAMERAEDVSEDAV